MLGYAPRCRTPPGVRELKRCDDQYKGCRYVRRTPPGVRELKLRNEREMEYLAKSHPSRGA